jgi:hypothetical protein
MLCLRERVLIRTKLRVCVQKREREREGVKRGNMRERETLCVFRPRHYEIS